MPLYKIIQRRQLGSRLYEAGEVADVNLPYEALERPEYAAWRRYLEPWVPDAGNPQPVNLQATRQPLVDPSVMGAVQQPQFIQ